MIGLVAPFSMPSRIQSFTRPIDLVEVLLGNEQTLIGRSALDLAEQRVELFLHLFGRALAALHHALRVDAKLLHLLEQRDRVLVFVERVAGAFDGLVLVALPDQPAQFLRLVLDHPPSFSCRRASTKRSRPVRSNSTRMA